jgi:hypothetical protein
MQGLSHEGVRDRAKRKGHGTSLRGWTGHFLGSFPRQPLGPGEVSKLSKGRTMNSETLEFEGTKGLVSDVIQKQATSLEKAVLEGVMNSVDAGADTIEITVDRQKVRIEDDGDGITEEEVRKYFKQFGKKDSDIEDKEFGKFRMGRGQLFNFGRNFWNTLDNTMVVNIREDTTRADIDGESVEVDTSGLGFELFTDTETHNGCVVDVELYEPLDDVSGKVGDVKKQIRYIPWLHGVTITVNGEEVGEEPTVEKETKRAHYVHRGEDRYSDSELYNLGAFVKSERLGPVCVDIIAKDELDVNFARNDVMDNCPVWIDIQEEYNQFCREYLLDKKDRTNAEKRFLLKEGNKEDAFMEKIKDEPLVDDVTGGTWSLNQLNGESITFGEKGDQTAEEAMKETSHVVLDATVRTEIEDLADPEDKSELAEVFKKDKSYEMEEVPEDKLKKKEYKRLKTLRRVVTDLGSHEQVKAGFSTREDFWKDDRGVIFVERSQLTQKKENFVTDVLFQVMKVAAHNGDTRDGFDKDYRYESNLRKYVDELSSIQRKMLKNAY